MKVGAAEFQSNGTDYEEFPMISNDFKSAYIPVRTLIYFIQFKCSFQVDPNVPIVIEGIKATC